MEEEITLDFRELFYVIRKRIILIIGITLICTITAGILSYFVIKPTYEAKTTIIVGKLQSNQKSNNEYNDVMMYQNLIKTYAEIAKSNSVAKETVEKLNNSISLQQFQKMITVTPQQGTQILVIKADARSPQEAVDIIYAVSSSFIYESKKVFPTGGDIQVMDTPETPQIPIKPKKTINIAIALLIGLIASIGLSLILEYMDSTIKSEEDVARYLKLPIIGIIPKDK